MSSIFHFETSFTVAAVGGIEILLLSRNIEMPKGDDDSIPFLIVHVISRPLNPRGKRCLYSATM